MIKTKIYRQFDEKDCGAACLATVFAHYGLIESIARIRQIAGTDKQGTNMLGLVEAAKEFGFDAKAVNIKGSLPQNLPLPAVAHVIIEKNMPHYVTIQKIYKGKIAIADPAKGIVKYTLEQFYKVWTKNIILIYPEAGLKPLKKESLFKKIFLMLLKSQKWLLFKIFILSLIYIVIEVIGAFYYQLVMNDIIPYNDYDILTYSSLALLALYSVQILLFLYRTHLNIYLSEKLDLNLALMCYKHVLNLPMSFFSSFKTREILMRFQDISLIRGIVSRTILTVMIDVIMVFAGGVMLYIQEPMLCGICMIVLFFYLIVYIIIVIAGKNKIEKENRIIREDNVQLSSLLHESLHGVQTIKAFNAQQKIFYDSENFFKKIFKNISNLEITTSIQDCLKNFLKLISFIVILWFGSACVIDGSITIGNLITFYALLIYFLLPVKSLIKLQPQIQTNLTFAERVADLMNLNTETLSVQDKEDLISFNKSIEIKDISFRYGRRKWVLKDISLTIRKGERIAFVGKNGSGKTTLAKLLLNFYKAEKGSINIDGTDMQNITKTNLRNIVAYISQKTFLMSNTVLYNLTLGNDSYDMEYIDAIAEVTKIKGFIEALPFGYQTKLEENGLNLSVEQRQRLAIARALIKKPSVLILDEVTSGLDIIAENAIQETIDKFNEDMTIIIITHRMSVLEKCDNIIVFENGYIVECGCHDVLMKKNGVYADLNNTI